MPAPGIEQLARRNGIGIDDGRSGANTLQPDRLPHQQHLVVGCLRSGLSGRRGMKRRGAAGGRHRDAPVVAQVGSTMIKSPGAAASIALWIVGAGVTWMGALPPMVTVTVSIDCLPLPAVMTSWPHCAVEPPYCFCCCMAQLGTPVGTVTVIERVAPARDRGIDSANGDRGDRRAAACNRGAPSSKAIVAADGLQIERSRIGRGP